MTSHDRLPTGLDQLRFRPVATGHGLRSLSRSGPYRSWSGYSQDLNLVGPVSVPVFVAEAKKLDQTGLSNTIYRPPQPKIVHVYDIVADHTQDVFLNHISFSKATSSDVFTKTTPSMSAYLFLLCMS